MKADIFGAVVFILDKEGRVLTLQEEETNRTTSKKAGQYSCVSETAKKMELPWMNVKRALEEELGMEASCIAQYLDFNVQSVWEAGYVDGVWATVVKLRCTNPSSLIKMVGSAGKPDGVKIVGFLPRGEFESLDLRPGVRNLVNNFGDDIFR